MPEQKGFLRPDELLASPLASLDEDTQRSFSDFVNAQYQELIGDPGEFPFTRGIYATMYRDKKPTMSLSQKRCCDQLGPTMLTTRASL